MIEVVEKSPFVAQSYCCFGSCTKTILHRFIVNSMNITKFLSYPFTSSL